jgi:hypothetical protein
LNSYLNGIPQRQHRRILQLDLQQVRQVAMKEVALEASHDRSMIEPVLSYRYPDVLAELVLAIGPWPLGL